jgi:hypothetical protein
MPGYIKKQLLKYKHIMRCILNCLFSPEPEKFGSGAQLGGPAQVLPPKKNLAGATFFDPQNKKKWSEEQQTRAKMWTR